MTNPKSILKSTEASFNKIPMVIQDVPPEMDETMHEENSNQPLSALGKDFRLTVTIIKG